MWSLWRCFRAGKVRKVPLEKRLALSSQVEVWYSERLQLVQVNPPEFAPFVLTAVHLLPCLHTSATQDPLNMFTSQFFPAEVIDCTDYMFLWAYVYLYIWEIQARLTVYLKKSRKNVIKQASTQISKWQERLQYKFTCVTWETNTGVAPFFPHTGAMVPTGTAVAQVDFCVTDVVLPHASETLIASNENISDRGIHIQLWA